MHPDVIYNDVLEVWAAETILKAMTRDGAFWPSLKKVWKLEQLRKIESKLGQYIVHYDAIWNDVLDVGNAEKDINHIRIR